MTTATATHVVTLTVTLDEPVDAVQARGVAHRWAGDVGAVLLGHTTNDDDPRYLSVLGASVDAVDLANRTTGALDAVLFDTNRAVVGWHEIEVLHIDELARRSRATQR